MSEKDQEGLVTERFRKRHQDKNKLKFLNLVNMTNMSGWWDSVLAISHLRMREDFVDEGIYMLGESYPQQQSLSTA